MRGVVSGANQGGKSSYAQAPDKREKGRFASCPFFSPSERDPIPLSQPLDPASDIRPYLLALMIAFGFKGGSLLLCSLDGTASVTSLKVPRKHIDGVISCWNPHCRGAPQKFTGLDNVAY